VDEDPLLPVEMGLRLLDLVRRMYPNDFRLLEGDLPFLSLLYGCRDLEDPNWDLEQLLQRSKQECQAFRLRKAKFEIYPKGTD
jgi:hypothetical protein